MLVKSQVKYIQSLSDKKFRDEAGQFVAEGSKLVAELLMAPNISPAWIYATRNWILAHPDLTKDLETRLVEIEASEMARISFLNTPSEVLGVFFKPQFPNCDLDKAGWVLLLDTIQDPGNLGTLIRIADWFGIATIVCSKETADAFNPKVVQSTMGGIVRVEVRYQPLAALIAAHPQIPLYAGLLNGKNLNEIGKPQPGFLLIGNESKGISPALLEFPLHALTIPRKGGAESLNAAVAAGILLSHLT